MNNHEIVDGQLLQTNKKWSALKESQQQRIMIWLREETAAYYQLHRQYPMGRYSEDVVDNVYDKIRAAGIWIPYDEVYRHYTAKKQHIINSLMKAGNQKKIYIDMTDPEYDGTSVIAKNAVVIPAGTTVYSMPISDKSAEYDQLAEEQDIHFIFDDHIPEVDFYTIPYIDIFAYDSRGGLLGTVGAVTDLESDRQIIYISSDHRCFVAGQSLKHFLSKGKHWSEHMKHWDKIQFFASVVDARRKYSFYHQGIASENKYFQEK